MASIDEKHEVIRLNSGQAIRADGGIVGISPSLGVTCGASYVVDDATLTPEQQIEIASQMIDLWGLYMCKAVEKITKPKN
jgi:phage gp45-like